MKKLIMFVVVFAIATPAVAELGEDADLNPPDWAGAPGTLYGTFNFDEALFEGSDGRLDAAENQHMEPHATNPDPEEFDDDEGGYMYQYYVDGATWHDEYEGREGVLAMEVGLSFDIQNFPGEGTKLIRIQMTIFGDPPAYAEVEAYDGGTGEYFEEFEPPEPISEINLGGGWFHITYEFEIPGNPAIEFIGFFDSVWALDQVVIDTICYPDDSPPIGQGRAGGKKSPITVDSNDIPVYEPQDDPCDPPVLGLPDGQLLVSLAWRPGEDPCYPNDPCYYAAQFIATVTVDPNTGDRPHEDFVFPDSVAADGSVTLTFTQANWDIPQNVIVEAVQDLDREGDESYSVELTVTIDIDDPNFNSDPCEPVITSVGVVDNDVPFVVVQPPTIEGQLSENDPCVPYCFDVTLSHMPNYDVHLIVVRESEFEIVLDSMSVMDPNFFEWSDPNRMHFTPGNYNTPQTICLEARDDDVRDEFADEEGLEWVPGVVILTPYSEDVRYSVGWLLPDPYGFPIDLGEDGNPDAEAEEAFVDFDVQDNDCGAVGYAPMDFNEDCRVGLGDFAGYYSQWLTCTEPYDRADQFGPGVPSLPPLCDAIWIE